MVEPGNYNLAQGEALKRDSNGSRYITESFNKFIPTVYNSIELTYNANNDVATVIYKDGSTTVGTLTLSYDDDKNLVGVVRT